MEELITLSELIDRLSIVNIKLYHLLEKTTELDGKKNKSKEDVATILRLSGDNIRLVKQRSQLKVAIDRKINEALSKGNTNILDEVKDY